MSAPKVPQHLVDQLLARGPLGTFTSVLLLGAATAVKRGEPVTDINAFHDEAGAIDAESKAMLLRLIQLNVEFFRSATPEQLDGAIALYTAHLTAAGYTIHQVEKGQEN